MHFNFAFNQDTHTQLFYGSSGFCPGLPGSAGSRKVKPGRQNQSGFTRARDSDWQWYLLGHMQICTSPQTDNHANIPPLSFYRRDAFPVTQPTASKHRMKLTKSQH